MPLKEHVVPIAEGNRLRNGLDSALCAARGAGSEEWMLMAWLGSGQNNNCFLK